MASRRAGVRSRRVGSGKLDPEDVAPILLARDRSRTPNMAPAHGLTLVAVGYPDEAGYELRADLTRRLRA